MTGGYEDDDCVLYKSEEVVASAKRNLDDDNGWLARLGKSDEFVKKHLDAAKQASAFAVIYTPSETDAERAMNVIRRVPFEFAPRYRRFAIQTIR